MGKKYHKSLKLEFYKFGSWSNKNITWYHYWVSEVKWCRENRTPCSRCWFMWPTRYDNVTLTCKSLVNLITYTVLSNTRRHGRDIYEENMSIVMDGNCYQVFLRCLWICFKSNSCLIYVFRKFVTTRKWTNIIQRQRSFISWRSVLLVQETRVPWEN